MDATAWQDARVTEPLYPGERIYVRAHWSSFHGARGVVLKSDVPGRVSVRLDGDMFPVLLYPGEVAIDDGAET